MSGTCFLPNRAGLGAALSIAAIAGIETAAIAQDDPGIRPDATMLQYPDVSSEEIVFVYANDLWLVPREGGLARKIASPPGQELFPRFSPDGSTIAFVGNYEGDRDLYLVPVRDAAPATRVTHHPASEVLSDWTPDGERLLYYSNGFAGLPRQQQIFTVDKDGGLPEQLPVPYGAVGAIREGGEWLAYTPHTRDTRTWKRYRGGMATDIWLFNLKDYTSRQVTDWEGTDTLPMWNGDTLYYLSDAGPEHRLNIWSYDTRSGQRSQITSFADYDVKWPSIGPGPRGRGEIVFQNGPRIMLLDLQNRKSTPVEIIIPGDRPTLRAQQVDYSEFIASGDISATGKRVAMEARGDIWTLPAEEGVTRNLTRTDGIAERDPIWSPDGQWIAYLSDETGEYEIYVTQSDGKGETRQITSDGNQYRSMLSWSPDSKYICFGEKSGEYKLVEVESGAVTLIATDPWATGVNANKLSWSHDSAWIALALPDDDNSMSVLHLYNVADKTLTPVTSNMFNSSDPAFDRAGKFIYFTSNRTFSPEYSDIDTTFVYNKTGVLLAVPLNSEVENPWLLESDEEEWDDAKDEDEASEDKDAKESGDDDADEDSDYDTDHALHGVWEGAVFGPAEMGFGPDGIGFSMTILVDKDGGLSGWSTTDGESEDFETIEWDGSTVSFSWTSDEGIRGEASGSLDGDTIKGTWSMPDMGITGTWEASRSDEEPDLEEQPEDTSDEPVVIDIEGFEERAMLIPVDAGNFSGLRVNDKNQLIYLRGGDGGAPSIKLFDMEDKDEGERNVLTGVGGFVISGDGKHLGVFAAGGKFAVVKAAPGQSMSKSVPTDQMTGTIDPRDEWKQIFHDAWRIQRDFFYDPGMHGVDWVAVRNRYEQMLDDCVTRDDLSYVIREMISELNVGHAYYWGGDTEDQPTVNVGLLGCDYELEQTEDTAAYRISKIYEGAAWDADARGPLSMPGIDIKEGDYLLAVNGVPVDTSRDPWAAFVGTAGAITELTVSEKPVMDEDARTVLVKPLGSEVELRYRHWIEQKRQYVDYRTDGKVGYIYVPNTGVPGQNDLFRQFYGQSHKAGLIIDERWNGGGQIPTRFIELLNRPITNYWARRDGNDWPWPPDAHQGPKCMLINGLAGSGGDMFPALFRQAGLGALIGTRTWGGLVGISGNPSLIDGGYTSVPTFGYYEKDGTWGIEGHGVDPDIEVIDDPALMVDGGDPQLDVAIDHIVGEIQRNPYIKPERPAGPDRSGMGITDRDK